MSIIAVTVVFLEMSWSHGEDLAHDTSHFSRSEEMIWCVLVHAIGGVQERCVCVCEGGGGGGEDASSPERDGIK